MRRPTSRDSRRIWLITSLPMLPMPGISFPWARNALARWFVGDQKAVDRAEIEIGVECKRAVDQRFDNPLVGDQVKVILRYRNRGAPGGRGFPWR